jgi:hypothetical protein
MTPNEKLQKLLATLKQIKKLEAKIAESDYKIIKCYEYSLVNIELPYDIQALHDEREALRE